MDIILGLVFCNQRHIGASHDGVRIQFLAGKKPHTELAVFLGGNQRCQLIGKLFARLQFQRCGGKRSAVGIQGQSIQLFPLRINRQIRIRLNRGNRVTAEILIQIPTGKGIPAPGRRRKRIGLVLFNLCYGCLGAVVGNHRQLYLIRRCRIFRCFLARHRQSHNQKHSAQQQKNTKFFHNTPLYFLLRKRLFAHLICYRFDLRTEDPGAAPIDAARIFCHSSFVHTAVRSVPAGISEI